MAWRIDGRAVLMGLRMWTARQTLVALGVAVLVGVLIGLVTVLIPNPVFARDIPPVWWDVPVLVLMSVLTGMLAATYVRDESTGRQSSSGRDGSPAASADAGGGAGDSAAVAGTAADGDVSSGRMGMVGTVLAWFAVGCPVCNKIALLALGYTGALTYFAPLQPVLAVLAIALTGVALLWRLQGRVVCPVPQRTPSTTV